MKDKLNNHYLLGTNPFYLCILFSYNMFYKLTSNKAI
jgi:hypothetical protein